MNVNSILKTGSSVTILIRTESSQTIGNKLYQQNEPYTILNNVYVTFGSSQEGLLNRTEGNLLNYNNSVPDNILIKNVALSDKILNLIFKPQQTIRKSYFYLGTVHDNKIILHHDKINNLFIFDQNHTLIGTAAEIIDRQITNDSFIENNQYYIFYEYDEVNASKIFNLESPQTSYFSIEIFGKGNQDNINSDVYLKFSHCSLDNNNLLMFDNSLNSLNLNFKIIKNTRINNNNYCIIN